jgi:ionotropic kainate glutamate receptor 2
MSLELLVKPFSPTVWLALVGSIIATIIAFHITESAKTNQTPANRKVYTHYTYGYILRSTLYQGAPYRPSRWSSRIVYTFYNGGWIILNATYAAFLVSFLLVKKDITPFTTIRELSENSDYKVGAVGGGIMLDTLLRFNFTKSNPYYKLKNKLLKDASSDETVIHMDTLFHYERVASEHYALLATTYEYNNLASESCSVDMLKEKGRQVFDGFALQKTSAYAADFDRTLTIMHEKMLDYFLAQKYMDKPMQCVSLHKNVDLEDICSVFYLLFAGMGIAFVVLVFEIVHKQLKLWIKR